MARGRVPRCALLRSVRLRPTNGTIYPIGAGRGPTEAEGKHQGGALNGKADDEGVQQQSILLNAEHGIRECWIVVFRDGASSVMGMELEGKASNPVLQPNATLVLWPVINRDVPP